MSQSYLSYFFFLTGFHWRISLLSRASRLGTVFNAGLRDSGLSCLSLLSLARSEMAIVRLPPDLSKKLTFFVFTSVEGKGTPLPFEAPANHLASFFFPLPMSGDPRSLRCKHLCDPQSFLTVTFWLLDNFSSTGKEYHSHLLVSVSHHVTKVTKSYQITLVGTTIYCKVKPQSLVLIRPQKFIGDELIQNLYEGAICNSWYLSNSSPCDTGPFLSRVKTISI